MSDVRKFKNLEERQAFLANLAEAHDKWHEKHEGTVADSVYDMADSNPHDKEKGVTDYPIFYLDRSASPEVEQEFFNEADKL